MTALATADMAARLGVTPAALRRAAARSGLPDAQIGRTPDGTGRSDRWDPDVTAAWWASRPGRWPARTHARQEK